MVPNIEHAVAIDGLLTLGVDGSHETPIVIIFSEGMGVGVTQHERKTMRLALREGNLQGIVIGDVAVLQVIDIVQIWELRVVWLGSNLGCPVRGAVVVSHGSTGETLSSGAVGICRIPPTGAKSVHQLRLIQ